MAQRTNGKQSCFFLISEDRRASLVSTESNEHAAPEKHDKPYICNDFSLEVDIYR